MSTSRIDSAKGVIYGATALQAGVWARGHFVTVDADGLLTNDAKKAARQLELWSDNETLSSALAAVQKRHKLAVNADHAFGLKNRKGFADNFRIEGDTLLCDVNFFEAARSKNLLFEAAEKTPEELGLSFVSDFQVEVRDGKAFARIKAVKSLDVVSDGALTPGGLFSAGKAGAQALKAKPALRPGQPEGTEFFASTAALSRRLLVSRTTGGRLVCSGKIAPMKSVFDGSYFRTVDIEAFRAKQIGEIAALVGQCNEDELCRLQLSAKFEDREQSGVRLFWNPLASK